MDDSFASSCLPALAGWERRWRLTFEGRLPALVVHSRACERLGEMPLREAQADKDLTALLSVL